MTVWNIQLTAATVKKNYQQVMLPVAIKSKLNDNFLMTIHISTVKHELKLHNQQPMKTKTYITKK